jgi:outer membrane protein TolC
MKTSWIGFCFILVFTSISFADHPNEGALTLEELQTRAQHQNRTILASEQASISSEKLAQSQKGAFLPEISLEGGPMSTRLDDEKNSGTAVYGKAEWNLYRGGRDQAELRKSEIERDLEKRKLEGLKSQVAREVSKLYYEMLYLLESISIKEQALHMNQDQMKLARAKRSSGLTSEADVLEFELRDSTLNSDLKLLQQQRSAKARDLSFLVGANEAPETLAVKGHLETESLKIDRTVALQHFKNHNLEILDAQSQFQISNQDKAIAKSTYLPKLDLEAQYGKIANEERVFDNTNNYRFFLKLNIPLFSGFQSYYDFSASQSKAIQKEMALQNTEIKVRSDLEGLFSELSSLEDRIQLEEKNLQRSESYYKMTISEYKRGLKNSPDVVGASERIMDAKIRNLEFRKEFQITKLRIYELAGISSQGM